MNSFLKGKLASITSLVEFAGNFRNWSEIWSAYRRDEPLPEFRLRDGLVIDHGDGDDPITIYREIFIDHCYTKGGFYVPKAGDVVVDIGANVGFFATYLCSSEPGVAVHCFEPSTRTRECLTKNVEQNGFSKSVTIHAFAVADRPGTVRLHHAADSGHRSIFEGPFVEASGEDVDCLSLEQVLGRVGAARIDLLKIDTEGAEIEIVEGLPLERWASIERVTAEFHDLLRPGCRERVTRVLEAAGFNKIDCESASPTLDLGVIRASRG